SLGESVSNILCASSRAASCSKVSGSFARAATFSRVSASSWFRSAQRNSGRHFSERNWLRQVLTATRETQCSKGTAPEYCSRWAKIFAKTICARSSSRSEEHTSELQSLAYLVC